MKILFHHRVASRDGQAVHIEELTSALREEGHEIVMVGPSSWEGTGFGQSNPAIDRIKRAIPGAIYELLELAYNLPAFLRLRRAVREHQPDVIYERFSLFLLAGIWVRRLTGVKLLLEVNSPLFEERARNDGLVLHRVGRWAQGMIWRNADAVLPVTGVLARTVASYGVPGSRITVIPNGIDPARFADAPAPQAARHAVGLAEGVVIGFIGFIRAWNALDRIVDFVADHRAEVPLQLLIVGDGPAREELQDRAARLGVQDRMTITGVVERDQVARHIAAFDIAVLPGLTPYSSPLKLFEYMVLGRAIVVPDTENIREILTDGEDALLFDPAMKGALEAALLRLARAPELCARLGAGARMKVASAGLTWQHNATRVGRLAALCAANREG
jgi:glycosyltransferase involved in cell wall biosynthesis